MNGHREHTVATETYELTMGDIVTIDTEDYTSVSEDLNASITHEVMRDISVEIDHLKSESVNLRNEMREKDQYVNNLIKIYDDNLSLVAEDIKCIREEYSHLNGMVTFLTRQLLNHRSPCSSIDSTLVVTDDEHDEPFSGDIENPPVIDDRFVTSRRKSKNPENNDLHTTKNAVNTTKIAENNDFRTFRDSFILIGLELGRLKEKQRKDNLVAQLQKIKN